MDTQRVIGVVRDITDRKRDEAERRLLEARVVRAQRMEGIGAVMCDVVQLASDLLTASVQIHTSLPKHSLAFAGVSTQIQQVLLNPLLNARDAMPGGGAITISARNAELGALGAMPASALPSG